MKVGIIGSGNVGQALAIAFAKSGYDVMLGTRDPRKHEEFQKKEKVKIGLDAEAARHGELLVLCTAWIGAENAVTLAGKENFRGKILIDVTNPLTPHPNGPPGMAIGYPDSAGATVQRWLPDTKVVKAFNVITASKMGDGRFKEGQGTMPIAGNDAKAKAQVKELLQKWNWDVIDMGDIAQSYLLEALAMLWIRYGILNNHWSHAFRLMRS